MEIWKQRVCQLQNEKQCLQHLLAKQQFEMDRIQSNDDDFTSSVAPSAVFIATQDKVGVLEDQLLCAEEMIVHLRAEKLELKRKLEILQNSDVKFLNLDDFPQNSKANRTEQPCYRAEKSNDAVADLTQQILNDQMQHGEKMAVIVEQEREIALLKDKVYKKDSTIAVLQQRNQDLVQEVERLENLNRILTQEDKDEEIIESSLASSAAVVYPATIQQQQHPEMEWREDTTRHPTPPFDLNSPEISYLLQQWSPNPKKQNYIKIWMQKVMSGQILSVLAEFPQGLELSKLRPEFRDGFLTLIIPLLRRQNEAHIQVHVRKHDARHSDLRIRIFPRENLKPNPREF